MASNRNLLSFSLSLWPDSIIIDRRAATEGRSGQWKEKELSIHFLFYYYPVLSSLLFFVLSCDWPDNKKENKGCWDKFLARGFTSPIIDWNTMIEAPRAYFLFFIFLWSPHNAIYFGCGDHLKIKRKENEFVGVARRGPWNGHRFAGAARSRREYDSYKLKNLKMKVISRSDQSLYSFSWSGIFYSLFMFIILCGRI